MIFDIVIQLCIEEFMSIKKIFVLCTVLCCIFFSLTGCKEKKEILFASEYVTLGNDVEPLIPLDSNAKTCLITEEGYANFKFSNKQKDDIINVYNMKGSAAISVRVRVCPTEKQQVALYNNQNFPLYFGFLSKKDFDDNGNLHSDFSRMTSTITVQANESKMIKDLLSPEVVFEIKMAVGYDDQGKLNIPEGVFIYSALNCEIILIDVDEAYIGYDYSNPAYNVYGFSSNGGIIHPESSSVDFSGGSLIFPANDVELPIIEVTLSDNPAYKSKDNVMFYVVLQAGNDKFQINNVPSAKTLCIPVSIFNNKFPRVDIVENKDCVTSIKMKRLKATNKVYNDVLSPLQADPGYILKYNTKNWRLRDYEIFQWDRFPEILIFDFKDFNIQDKYLKRMAFFVEKTGYKGRLVTNEEFEGIHGFNANDYKAEDFARFYNLADEQNFKLNEEEYILKKYLINNGILLLNGDGSVKAGKGGIASASRESGTKTEARLLNHEVLHTLFFIDEGFRNYVVSTYSVFDPKTKQFLIDYFDANPQWNYDTNDEYLMHNEYMSYILEHKSSDVGPFFVDRARNYPNVRNYTPELSDYIIETGGSGFTEAAKAMESYTFDTFGLLAGNVGLINKF